MRGQERKKSQEKNRQTIEKKEIIKHVQPENSQEEQGRRKNKTK
jgi:hypothetical protein